MMDAAATEVAERGNEATERSESASAPGRSVLARQAAAGLGAEGGGEARQETAGKYAPFYGDVYGPAFFGPLISFDSFHGMPFAQQENQDALSVLTSPLFTPRRVIYQSVPTEETSLVGRERRKKQTQKTKKAATTPRPFHYMSALCGAAFPGGDSDPFSLFQRPPDRIPAVYTTTPISGNGYHDTVHHTDVSELLHQLLSEDFPPADLPNATALQEEKNGDEEKEAEQQSRQKRGRRACGETTGENGVPRSEEMADSIAAFAPQIKRKRVTKEGAYKRKKGNSVSEGRSSRFRGVTKHRRSGRWEAHIWIKEMGRQVYLGGYEKEEHAAEAYDVAAIKSKGEKVKTNFDIARYTDLRAVMDSISMDELVMIVRRQSQGFSRGTSVFRGVTHHPSGRWEARIGIPGSKHIYLGLYNDEVEAAKWYDRALVRLRGQTAATNFLLSNYREEMTEYQELQQAVLQSLSRQVLEMSASFENWVKYGRKGVSGNEEQSSLAPGSVMEECPLAETVNIQEKKQLVSQLVMRAMTDDNNRPELSTISDLARLQSEPVLHHTSDGDLCPAQRPSPAHSEG